MKRYGKLPSLTVAMLTILLTATACTSKDESKVEHMQKAKALIEKGDLDKARVELKNVMQIDPKYAEAYYQNGLLEEKQENMSRAYGSFMKALELAPDHIDAKTRLARIQLMA
jgi:Tfp pilus assembly protein PilF